MKILFDNGTPKPIARSLAGHTVSFARRVGWHELKNGELIQQAEDAGYEVLLSTDKNIRYQQNLTGRKIALVILGNQKWPLVKLHLDKIAVAVNAATPGSFTEVDIPAVECIPVRNSAGTSPNQTRRLISNTHKLTRLHCGQERIARLHIGAQIGRSF